jgi:hypothetical protein
MPVREKKRTKWINRVTPYLSLATLLLSLIGFAYMIYRDAHAGHSNDRRFAAIESSLRTLTQMAAPQIYQSISDSLQYASIQDAAHASQALHGVDAALQQLRNASVTPDQNKLKNSSQLLSKLISVHPELPEVWQTASELISYRSEPQSTTTIQNLGNCVDRPWTVLTPPPPNPLPPGKLLDGVMYHDCTLVIDDLPAFMNGPAGRGLLLAQIKAPGRVYLSLILQNVHVVYRGGEILPAFLMIFQNCTFGWDIPRTVPPSNGRHLTSGLLAADLSNFRIQLMPVNQLPG